MCYLITYLQPRPRGLLRGFTPSCTGVYEFREGGKNWGGNARVAFNIHTPWEGLAEK